MRALSQNEIDVVSGGMDDVEFGEAATITAAVVIGVGGAVLELPLIAALGVLLGGAAAGYHLYTTTYGGGSCSC